MVLEIFAVEHSFEDAARRSRQADVRIGLCSLFMRKPYRKRSSGYGDAEIGRVGLPREGRHDGRGRGSRAAQPCSSAAGTSPSSAAGVATTGLAIANASRTLFCTPRAMRNGATDSRA